MVELKPVSFVIYGQPATKKNSSTIVGGRAKLLPSKTYRDYERSARDQLNSIRCKGIRLPHYTTGVNISVKYYLQNRAHWPDLVGLMQATADIISDEYKIIRHKRQLFCPWVLADDRIIKSWNGTCIAGIDKDQPRAEVTITPNKSGLGEELDPYVIKQLEKKQLVKLF